MYQHSFIGKRYFDTCFNLHEVIIMRIYQELDLSSSIVFLNVDP
jgi:hypothetical protein